MNELDQDTVLLLAQNGSVNQAEDEAIDLDGPELIENDEPTVPEATVAIDVGESHEGIVKQNVSIVIPTTQSLPIDDNVIQDVFPLPTETLDRTNVIFENVDRVPLTNSEQSRKWAQILQAGSEAYTFEGKLSNTLSKKGSAFTNNPEVEGKNLRVRSLNLKSGNNGEIRGTTALLKLDKYWGIGEPTATPLWHSGFSVTFKAPNEPDFIELQRVIDSDKIKLGRESYGPLYSNYTCYTQERLLDFMIRFIHNTSLALPSNDINDIKQYIKPQDINLMVCGIMKARYPNGFLYKRACSASPGKCDHVDEGKLFLDAITHVDMNALTPSQKHTWLKLKLTHTQSNLFLNIKTLWLVSLKLPSLSLTKRVSS